MSEEFIRPRGTVSVRMHVFGWLARSHIHFSSFAQVSKSNIFKRLPPIQYLRIYPKIWLFHIVSSYQNHHICVFGAHAVYTTPTTTRFSQIHTRKLATQHKFIQSCQKWKNISSSESDKTK